MGDAYEYDVSVLGGLLGSASWCMLLLDLGTLLKDGCQGGALILTRAGTSVIGWMGLDMRTSCEDCGHWR